ASTFSFGSGRTKPSTYLGMRFLHSLIDSSIESPSAPVRSARKLLERGSFGSGPNRQVSMHRNGPAPEWSGQSPVRAVLVRFRIVAMGGARPDRKKKKQAGSIWWMASSAGRPSWHDT